MFIFWCDDIISHTGRYGKTIDAHVVLSRRPHDHGGPVAWEGDGTYIPVLFHITRNTKRYFCPHSTFQSINAYAESITIPNTGDGYGVPVVREGDSTLNDDIDGVFVIGYMLVYTLYPFGVVIIILVDTCLLSVFSNIHDGHIHDGSVGRERDLWSIFIGVSTTTTKCLFFPNLVTMYIFVNVYFSGIYIFVYIRCTSRVYTCSGSDGHTCGSSDGRYGYRI